MTNLFFFECDIQLCACKCVFVCYGGFRENSYRNMNGLKLLWKW